MTSNYFKRRTVEACTCTRESSGSETQTAEMEVNWSSTEEEFLYHRKINFELGYPRTKSKRKPEKELEGSGAGGSWNSGKDLERGHGNSWEHSPLVLLRGGTLFRNKKKRN